MKIPFLLLLCTAAFYLAGCAGNEPTSQSAARTGEQRQQNIEEEEEEQEVESIPPRIGMSKSQVRKRYGRPYNVSSSPRGEVWNYVFNKLDGRDFIPVYGGWHQAFKKRHGGRVTFNSAGRVVDFDWNEANPIGASIYR